VETLLSLLNPIINALSAVLRFLYGITHEYTLAIVLLTLLVKLVLHPLTRVQLRSMKAMQALAPDVAVLRGKYRDDPKTLNQEIMALYRARQVSPFSGCLPTIVQMPVLWALFQLLARKGLFGEATVFGIPWIRLDEAPWAKLSQALPNHPEWLLLIVFPALVAFTTWRQQRLTVTDPQQAKMFAFMPALVGVFAVNYQVGLSVYWIVSTTAYIGEYLWVVGRPQAIVAAPPQPQVHEAERAGTQPARVRRRKKRAKRR
jgi:YidC/Oxa1 family membrane protein insertase